MHGKFTTSQLVCRRLSGANAGAAPPSQVIYYEGHELLNICTSDVYLTALLGADETSPPLLLFVTEPKAPSRRSRRPRSLFLFPLHKQHFLFFLQKMLSVVFPPC